MHPKVESYIQEKEAARKSTYEKEKQTFLLREHFTEFVPNPKQDVGYTDEYPCQKSDPETGKICYGKMVPIEISDEEYELLRAASGTVGASNQNKVASLLQVIAYVIYCAAALAALILFLSGDENLWPFAFAAIPAGLISGTSFLGFAEIIKLLHQINRKVK